LTHDAKGILKQSNEYIIHFLKGTIYSSKWSNGSRSQFYRLCTQTIPHLLRVTWKGIWHW